MNRISLLFIGLLIVGSLVAQNRINYTNTAPEIDGFPEDVWWNVETYPIDKPIKTETPTITATWQAIYDDENFYVLVSVEDDDHWPGWQANGESKQYDMPEIFWDVNEVLDDGKGAKDVGSGHYQFAEGFVEDRYDEPLIKGASGINPGGIYCYSLIGEGYVYELAVPLANFNDASGISFGRGYNTIIGFDVTIVDQDEGTTTVRQRCVWSNDGNGNEGSIDESWNNMDGAGEIIISYNGPSFSLSSYNITLQPESDSNAQIFVNTDVSWTAVSNQTWLVVSPDSAKGDKMVTITATENSGATRSAYVRFNMNISNSTTLYVTQEGKVGNQTLALNKIKISPNPAITKVIIDGDIDHVQLFNSLGVLVKETAVKGKTISVAELLNGIYMVKAYKNGQFVGMAKIIKN